MGLTDLWVFVGEMRVRKLLFCSSKPGQNERIRIKEQEQVENIPF